MCSESQSDCHGLQDVYSDTLLLPQRQYLTALLLPGEVFVWWLVRGSLELRVLTTFLSAAVSTTLQRVVSLEISVIASTYSSFLISLLLSCVYVVGYYCKTSADVGSRRKAEIRNTCTVEILFDITVISYTSLATDNCLMPTMIYETLYEAKYPRNCFEVASRLQSLEFGVGQCGVHVLSSQPLFQESAALILALITCLVMIKK